MWKKKLKKTNWVQTDPMFQRKITRPCQTALCSRLKKACMFQQALRKYLPCLFWTMGKKLLRAVPLCWIGGSHLYQEEFWGAKTRRIMEGIVPHAHVQTIPTRKTTWDLDLLGHKFCYFYLCEHYCNLSAKYLAFQVSHALQKPDNPRCMGCNYPDLYWYRLPSTY